MRNIYLFIRNNLEVSFWIFAIFLLAFSNPHEKHYSLCLFDQMGFPYCPGCGIGHSISYFFHGKISASFQAHPLGMIATLIILYRIFQLTILKKTNPYKISNHG